MYVLFIMKEFKFLHNILNQSANRFKHLANKLGGSSFGLLIRCSLKGTAWLLLLELRLNQKFLKCEPRPPKKGTKDFCSSLENLASALPQVIFYTPLAAVKTLLRKCFLSNKTSPSVGIRHNPIPLSNKDAIVAFEIQKKKFPHCFPSYNYIT